MSVLITDPELEERLKAERQSARADRYDEVWEGVYVMTRFPNDEHQEIVGRINTILEITIGWTHLGKVRPGVNITDRQDNWTQNFRCPDVVVFLNETKAQNRGTHWYGAPDFVVEVSSPGDRVPEKT